MSKIATAYRVNVYYPGKSDPELIVNVETFEIDSDGFVRVQCIPTSNWQDVFVFNPRFYSYVHVEAETKDA